MNKTKSIVKLVISIALAFTFSCSSGGDDNGGGKANTFKDDRDGKSYKWVEIGYQIWMAENLNYRGIEPDTLGRCYYNDPTYCKTYGRLYNWTTAMVLDAICDHTTCDSQINANHKGICPSGWHIPSNEEWDKLLRYVDGTSEAESPYSSPTAGKFLKATSGWNDHNGKSGNGNDKFGFFALPGGLGNSGVSFAQAGKFGYWWSTSEYNSEDAYDLDMAYTTEDVYYSTVFGKNSLFSVRCVKDN